ncbi:MAG: lactate utilization protein [Clostridia bacterium]|nr:lactate utilization protein [Clostridia bacterium]
MAQESNPTVKEIALAVRGNAVVQALKRKGYDAWYFARAEEAAQKILELIPAGASVGVGGSITIREMRIPEALRQRGHEVFDHWNPELSGEERALTLRRQLTSDVFITSANAISMDGQIVNVDGTGNRVASSIFGPKKVIIVAGINKLVPTLEDALSRSRGVAGVMNAARLKCDTPCVELGRCSDCQRPDRICNVTVIFHRRPQDGSGSRDYHVIIVGQELGF